MGNNINKTEEVKHNILGNNNSITVIPNLFTNEHRMIIDIKKFQEEGNTFAGNVGVFQRME